MVKIHIKRNKLIDVNKITADKRDIISVYINSSLQYDTTFLQKCQAIYLSFKRIFCIKQY